MTFTYGSVCTGYEGIGLGLSLVEDIDIRWQAENDPHAAKILATRFPDVPNLHDIKTVDWTQVEPVDIFSAGFPCQPFSHAGKRAGERDERHIWPYIAQAIAVLRPKRVFLENVRGLLSIGGDFVEPNDRCVCGWPVRRGGLHRGDAEPWRLVDQLCDRHDGESSDDARPDGARVRRSGSSTSTGDREVGRSVDMGAARLGSGGFPASSVAVLDPQARAGSVGVEDGGDPVGVDGLLNRSAAPLDTRGVGAVSTDSYSDQGAQPQGSVAAAGEPANQPDCPSCGRTVDDYAERPVFRSGLGTVFGDLARLGFDARWGVVRAADAGASHGRARLFIVATDARGERHGGRQDGRGVDGVDGVDGDHAGEARQRQRSRPVARDRDTETAADADDERRNWSGLHRPRERRGEESQDRDIRTAADASRHGRDEGRPEPARLIGGSDAAERSPVTTDADGLGLQGVRWLESVRRDPDRCGSTDVAWGAYEPAIRRWESVTGRPAPRPTEPGRSGERLAPTFVEWLMGLPAGWVTDIDISRNEKLKALGNGVVPQQCALAWRTLTQLVVAA